MTLPSNSKRKIFDGRYEILSIVGRGADSVVYHGRHITGAAQEVAIKVLINRDGKTTLTDKLRREALTLVSCRHKYVVRLDDFHSIQDLCYLSMEYAASGDLLKFIATLPNKRLTPAQVALFLKQSLEAIDFVHATGVIHRDLRPENILVVNEKEIRVADFGLALLPGDDVALEELRKAVGSFDYLAPEVLDGVRYDAVSDLYALGVCFYEVASGKHPFSHAPIAEQREARNDARITPLEQVVPDLPPHVAGVITTLMKFSAQDRFPSASDALRALADPQFAAVTPAASTGRSAPVTTPANDDAVQPRVQVESPSSSTFASSAQANTATAVQVEPPVTPQQRAVAVEEASPRPSTPTEKIDLERIKAIIARDSERRTTSSGTLDGISGARGARPIHETPADSQATPAATYAPALTTRPPASTATSPGAPRQRSSSAGPARSGVPLLATALIRFVGIAVSFAILTVGGSYGYHYLTRSSAKKASQQSSSVTAVAGREGDETAADESAQSNDGAVPAPPLMQLPEGVYPGVIQGLFPGPYVPMALISNPDQQHLTLMIGVSGWVPTTVSTAVSTDGARLEGPTFRSNGLILKFNQESSSGAITGTVLDVVTGEAGTWKVTK